MADEAPDNFTLPVGIAPDVTQPPSVTPIPNSAGQPIFTTALTDANAAAAPGVKVSADLQAQSDVQDAANQAAQQKAAQQKLYSDYVTHLQTGLGGLNDYLDQLDQTNPDIAAQGRALIPHVQDLLNAPDTTPQSARDYLNTVYDALSKQKEAADKAAAAEQLVQDKQKQDLLAPKFDDWLTAIKQNPSYDADKLGRPFTANEQAVLRQSAGQLNGYPKFEAYLKGSTTPAAKPPNSAPNTSAPTEAELLAEKDLIVNNGDTVQNYIQSLPKRGMSSQEMTRIRTTLTQMAAGTYKSGSYRPSTTSNQPAPIPKAPPMNPDGTTPAPVTPPAPLPKAPPVQSGNNPDQNGSPVPSPAANSKSAPIPSAAAGIAPPSPVSSPSSGSIPGYSITGDEGDAKYWNNKNTKTAIANIQNARSTIGYLMNVYKGLDNSQFPTWNAFINSASPLVGGVKAKMAQLNTALAREEVQKAMARGGTGNVEQLKLTNAMFDPNASIPQQMAGGKAMLDAMDRWQSAVSSGGGRFAGNSGATTPAAPVDFKAYTAQNPSPKSNSTADISAWLKGAGTPITPQSIAATQRWMASQQSGQ